MQMLEIATRTNIAFSTDFWMSLTLESFMTMSMDWIMQNWHLKMRILGTMHFPRIHTIANISNHLLNAYMDFGVWPKDAEGSIPKNEEDLSCNKLAYFGMEPSLDRLVMTSNCGSRKEQPLGLESLCVSLFEHS